MIPSPSEAGQQTDCCCIMGKLHLGTALTAQLNVGERVRMDVSEKFAVSLVPSLGPRSSSPDDPECQPVTLYEV